jgi:hypothetical protein
LPDSSGTLQVSGAAISGTTGTFTGLVDISAAGAGQIKFPATQNASANANTLDDYEEGTFTATWWSGNDLSGTNLGTSSGNLYTKIGRTVVIQFNRLNAGAGNSGSFSGLPFSIAYPASGISADSITYFADSGTYLNTRAGDNSYARGTFVYTTS